MVYLRINDGKGYFLAADDKWQEIHNIRKEDILRLLDFATDSSICFEMDEIKDNSIKNEAHKIIYDNLYRKFSELLENKSRFIDESESLYREAFQKYTNK